jgi:hypothetical protein
MKKFRFSAHRRKNPTRSSSSKGKNPPYFSSIPPDASSTSKSISEENTKDEYGNTSRTECTMIAPSEVDMLSKYGYEDCRPSEEIAAKKYDYGEYGNTSRTECTMIAPSEEDMLSKYGYEDCSPSEEISTKKYDYGEAQAATSPPRSSTTTPRRSSMKNGEGNTRRPPRCAASIGYCAGEIEVNLPGKREPVRRRTSISFCEKDQITEVVPVKSLTDDPEALWFQDEEYSAMNKKMCSLIHAVERGTEASTKKYCIRGLEGHFGEGAESREISRGSAWDAVLMEQRMQQKEGSFDDEGISMLYRLSSIDSKIKAAQRATQDESEVGHYQRDTRRRMRRMSM